MKHSPSNSPQLEIGKPIPDSFLFQKLCEPITGPCCREVQEIISKPSFVEYKKGNTRVALIHGEGGDMIVKQLNNKKTLSLAQRGEIDFFALLLKAAAQVGELENVLFPKGDIPLQDWMNILEKKEDNEIKARLDNRVFSLGEIPIFDEKSTKSCVQIQKYPHSQENYYEVFIDKQRREIVFIDLAEDIFSRNQNTSTSEFRIGFDEVNDYLKAIFSLAKIQQANPERYTYILDYIFSPQLGEMIESDRKWEEKNMK